MGNKLFLIWFSRYFHFFVLTFCPCRKNSLIRHIKLTSKFMTLQRAWQAIKIHILPSIVRTKANQTIKFGQLLKYKTRKIFLEKPYTKQSVIFNPWKVLWNWIASYQNSFVISPDSLYDLIRRDSGRLANRAFKSNPIVSWKQ